MRFSVVSALVTLPLAVGAQEVRRALPVAPETTPPPVRRAEPVNPATYENPAWMERVRPAEPVTPAPPAATPIPVATPLPSTPAPTATPGPEASPEPGEPLAPAPSEAAPDQSRALTAANGFYRRKMYDMAVYEYERFLIAEPQAEGRDGALFRLGESHRFLGNERAARDAYQRLLMEAREGEFVGAGAYRLGEILYTEGDYARAAELFGRAEANATEAAVKLSAVFYQANAYEKLGRRAQALERFRVLAAAEGDNPYRDSAAFALAEDAARAGRKEAALEAYEKLAASAGKPELKVEAAVKAAALASELGRADRAKELFEQALADPQVGDWSGVARLGVMRLAYEAGRYREVITSADRGLSELPRDAQPEALLIVANSRRQLGETEKALALYDQILREHPATDAAAQAKFQRLVCLEATGAKDLTAQLDAFLADNSDPLQTAQARLLKAETLFKAGDYQNAAPLYQAVLKSPLAPRLRTAARYKLGWCQLQTGQAADAAQTFTLFIDQNPKSELLPAAITQRALALQQGKAYEAALADFDRVIKEFPKAPEREVALQQRGLVLGQLERYDEMAAAFTQLLAEFPKSRAAAQAEYWIGWRAFEKKDYPTAVTHLERARELDEKAFGERASLRIILAYYYQENRDAVARAAAKADLNTLPAEVLAWLGMQYFEAGDYDETERFLGPLVARGSTGAASPDALLALSRARLAREKFEAARDPIRQYLAAARDPLSRAKGLLASAEVSLGTGSYEDANKLVEEAMLLQPEGPVNAEARLLAGEVMMQRQDYAGAARAFMTISVLHDDPKITPRALTRAAAAYRKAGDAEAAEKALAERDQRYPDAKPSPTPRGKTARKTAE